MLGKYLKAALVFVLASAAAAQTVIYMDYTSHFSTILPTPLTSSIVDATYNTHLPGAYSFGVDWNGDATDEYTITLPVSPSSLVLTALNSPTFCTGNATNPNIPNQVTFTNSSVHQCNYTANWTTPFTGVLTVTYNGGANTNSIRADSISTFFINSAIVGDPQFVGLRGQSFQVHGVDGAVYNIISDQHTQVNSRFTFLTEGQCPVVDGVVQENCWSHPGSYMGEMSFQAMVDDKLHAALLTAGDAKKGFAMVQVDGKPLKVGDKVEFGSFSVEMVGAYKVLIATEQFEFELSNSDKFINQALRSKVALSKLHSHGLLGQTHSSKTHASPLKYIEGEVDDYVIADNDIFGNDFLFNKFQM